MPKLPTGALIVEEAKDSSSLYWAAKFRHDGKGIRRRLGKAWLEPRDEPLEGATGWQKNFRKRRGRPAEGHLSADDAVAAMRELIAGFSDKQERKRQKQDAVTFAEAAVTWQAERSAISGWKATTARNYSAMLAAVDHVPKRRGHKPRARIMRAFGTKLVSEVTTQEVAKFLRTLDADDALTPRSVNAHRQVLGMVFDYVIEQGWRTTENPVTPTKKRREADPKELTVYSPEQIFAVASEAEGNIAPLIVVAGFSGLRQGELLELRWKDVDFVGRKLTVSRSFSSGLGITSTKGRRARVVPMADQVAQVLAQESQRGFLIRKGDLVFPGPKSNLTGGTPHDPSSLRAAYVTARDAAAAKDHDLPVLRFHDLRHSFGSLAAAGGVDAVKIQSMMGHADSRTTARYLHAVSRADDADRLSRAFGSGIEQVEKSPATTT